MSKSNFLSTLVSVAYMVSEDIQSEWYVQALLSCDSDSVG